MSTIQIIQNAQHLPLQERFEIIEALYASIRKELDCEKMSGTMMEREPFELITFDLGEEVYADRDEIYAERGL